ncbi:MAG: DUF664 domain-containing protein [Terrimonas sp.]|nr:DUF664 domain-containing protein [Terrimonas sp.]
MRKRKFGYVLLFLLVVSGFAGMSTNNSLTKDERKFASNHLKETRNDLFKVLKGLSEEQLNYKASPDRWSVKECAYHIALSENNLWNWIENMIKTPANPERRPDIKTTDAALIKGIENRDTRVKTQESFEPKNAPWKSLPAALAAFKDARNKHITYIKTTTEDLRNHIADSPIGALDAYQMVLFLSAHTNRHLQQIEEVMADPKFPK